MSSSDDSTPRAPLDLFGDRALAAYENGQAAELVRRRNRHLGHLLLADRAVVYVQILYRLLLFRRSHELEPLHEELYEAVRPAQERCLGPGGGYDQDQFRADLAQLEAWALISCRIEAERLRGYRDTRRRKFRYRLSADAVSFLEWLEERAQSDLYRPEEDARDLLEETLASLRELGRLLALDREQLRDGGARRIVYQLAKLDALSLDVNAYLGGFNARLLTFAAHEYHIEEVRAVLRELREFVDGFLRQVHQLRGAIGEEVARLLRSEAAAAVAWAAAELETERRRMPALLRREGDPRDPRPIPMGLWEFFREDGHLDLLCRRVRESSILVWRKLHAHLREVERRSTRLQDIRARCAELAALPETVVPYGFLRELLAPAVMVHDPHYWDEHERAEPPRPRRRSDLGERQPPTPIRPKRRRGGTVVSLEQARLQRLGGWLQAALGKDRLAAGVPLSHGRYESVADFTRILELSKAGLLGEGRRLRRVGFCLSPVPGRGGTVNVQACSLSFPEMTVRCAGEAPRKREAP